MGLFDGSGAIAAAIDPTGSTAKFDAMINPVSQSQPTVSQAPNAIAPAESATPDNFIESVGNLSTETGGGSISTLTGIQTAASGILSTPSSASGGTSAASGIPTWVWAAAGGLALIGAVIFFKKS